MRARLTLVLLLAGLASAQTSDPPWEGSGAQIEQIGAGLWLWSVGAPGDGRQPEKPFQLVVENAYGAVRIRIEATDALRIRARLEGREATADDIAVTRKEKKFRIRGTPPDGRPLDLEITAPFGIVTQAATVNGAIAYSGFGIADFQTDHGAVTLAFPAEATRFELLAEERPLEFTGRAVLRKSGNQWIAADKLEEWKLSFGQITLRSRQPSSITLIDDPRILKDSPVKMPWQAEELLPRLFRQFEPRDLRDRREKASGARGDASRADFTSDVRLVQLDVSVTDKEGRPVPGLGPEDFEVVEDGEAQTLTDVSNVDAPFNLVLLLDCSSSTEAERPKIRAAAQSFINVAREQDKVAVYALGETLFLALSHLTADHDRAREGARAVEQFGGASPLYDMIVLSYAEELAALPRERNALVILSDGVDNRISHPTMKRPKGSIRPFDEPSHVSFAQLRKAAEEMETLIYPIVLDPVKAMAKSEPLFIEHAKGRRVTVHEQAKQLAKATGGRPFFANSLDDLDAVYGQVAQELRSIYTLSYSPQNQDFDGKWRRVRVRTKDRDLGVRTRAGYFAY